ncbi:AAA family ATPase [Catellatospora bangladeshensis]|uniref:AAA+ ATPase domain-containing protein n=1 Tax=Catellatospora bangladeshensis TaxID=310355 RepID=A0A8J3JK89_9ACTN|nr:AAA family ATPase [Catellatospora bangladeshensis]GIF86526.1 hypothetical protein Cba03nite_78750 [Catellatospora bangladeshensis]
MRITGISVKNFLGVTSAAVSTDRPLTVITGANGSGKSTLLHALRLMVDALGDSAPEMITTLERKWATAGRLGTGSFEIRVRIQFEDAEERALIDAFYRAATLNLCHPEAADVPALTAAIDALLPAESSKPLTNGELVVLRDASRRNRWTVGWEFEASHGQAHVQVLGDEMPNLVDGPVTSTTSNTQYMSELLTATNNIVPRILADQASVDLLNQISGRRIDFLVAGLNAPAQPEWIIHVWQAVGHRGGIQDRLSFGAVLRTLIGARLQITDNHRAPVRTEFEVAELAIAPNLSDGALLALELHRLKNGGPDERERFARTQDLFRQLTGVRFDSTQQTITTADGVIVSIEPVIEEHGATAATWDVPLRRAGAGSVEALLLATLIADTRRCLFLDEPGVHLSPTAQARLLSMLRSRGQQSGQAVWVTHNPDLVPATSEQDLHSIVRLSQGRSGDRVHTLRPRTPATVAAITRLLATAEVRSVLFAEGLVIFEGPTDVAAFSRWLADGAMTNDGQRLPSPGERNIAFVAGGGDSTFGSLAGLADELGVPWAIVTDGPAMQPASNLAKQLTKLRRTVPLGGSTLTDVVNGWAKVGVHTLADQFGADGTKGGEIEAFFQRTDPAALAQAQRDVGNKKSPRVGAAFADAVPIPSQVVELWAALLTSLDLPV